MSDITISAQEVARELGTSPQKIKAGILNGTLPIGTVLRDAHSTQDRIIIIKKRWEKYKEGEDLTCRVRSDE